MNRFKAIFAVGFVMAALVIAWAQQSQQSQSTSTQTSTSRNGQAAATATASSRSGATSSSSGNQSASAGSMQAASGGQMGRMMPPKAMEVDDEFVYIVSDGALKKFSKNGLTQVGEVRLGDGNTMGQAPNLRLDDRCAYVIQGSKLFQVNKANLTIAAVVDVNSRDQIR